MSAMGASDPLRFTTECKTGQAVRYSDDAPLEQFDLLSNSRTSNGLSQSLSRSIFAVLAAIKSATKKYPIDELSRRDTVRILHDQLP
jgi:hypothetical protein